MEKDGLGEQRLGRLHGDGVCEEAEERSFPCLSLALSFHLSYVHLPPSSYRHSLCAYCVRCTTVRETGFRQTAAHVINNNQTQKLRCLCALPCCLGPGVPLLSCILPPCPSWAFASVAFQSLLKAGILDCCWPERQTMLAPMLLLRPVWEE